ncbi:hypothetical protein QBC44DRAFT_372382 [Cladorrhinum sp. PSN332]|nr:hypothetical protein QBC44DRAFT_372382 [Cladorrhinum sp. PSN332]
MNFSRQPVHKDIYDAPSSDCDADESDVDEIESSAPTSGGARRKIHLYDLEDEIEDSDVPHDTDPDFQTMETEEPHNDGHQSPAPSPHAKEKRTRNRQVTAQPTAASARARRQSVPPARLEVPDSEESEDVQEGEDEVPAPNPSEEIHEFDSALDANVRRYPGVISNASEWMKTSRPKITSLDDVKKLLPLLQVEDHSNWTEMDRKRVQHFWDKDPQRGRRTMSDKSLLKLHKISLRVFHCLPEDIISSWFDLGYNRYNNRQTANPRLHWSSPFSDALSSLLVHPMWQGDFRQLSLAIQYTVIADTEDFKGPWFPEVPPDPFLLVFLDTMKTTPGIGILDARKLATAASRRVVWSSFPGSDSSFRDTSGSHWSNLFQSIESVVKSSSNRPGKEESSSRDPSEPRYQVTTGQLNTLRKALNSMGSLGFPMYPTVELLHAGINGRRDPKDYPQSQDIRALREYAILRERERAEFKKNNRIEVPRTQMPSMLANLSSAYMPGIPAIRDLVPETQEVPDKNGAEHTIPEVRDPLPEIQDVPDDDCAEDNTIVDGGEEEGGENLQNPPQPPEKALSHSRRTMRPASDNTEEPVDKTNKRTRTEDRPSGVWTKFIRKGGERFCMEGNREPLVFPKTVPMHINRLDGDTSVTDREVYL